METSNQYISVSALESALANLMERRGVKSWLETAFDASDIDDLIHEPFEIITLPDRCLQCVANQEADS